MIGPLEIYFSAYFVSSPPFIKKLTRSETIISERIRAVAYTKANDEVIKYDLEKRNGRRSNIDAGDNIRSIMLAGPDQGFARILCDPDSYSTVWYRGYQWKWTTDVRYLRAIEDVNSFYLTANEAQYLYEIMFKQLPQTGKAVGAFNDGTD